MSPLSLKDPSIPDDLFESGSGASALPGCGLRPVSPVTGLPLHTGKDSAAQETSLGSFDTDGPALSGDGSFPWLSSSPDTFQRHLRHEAPDLPFAPTAFGGTRWNQKSVPDLRAHGWGMFQAEVVQPGRFGW